VRQAAIICPRPCKLTFDLESGVRATCDVGYLCANFSLPRPLCSGLRPDVRYRQTSDVHHRLMPPTQWLKWFCEAGGSPDEARLEQTPYAFQPH